MKYSTMYCNKGVIVRLRQALDTLVIIPVLLILSVPLLTSYDIGSQSLADTMWSNIFGRLSSGNIQSVILSFTAICCILIFILIYGTYITRKNCTLIIIRVGCRAFWAVSEIMWLMVYALLYSVILSGMNIWICTKSIGDVVVDKEAFLTAILIAGILFSAIFFFTLIVNWITLKVGIAISIMIVFAFILVLEIIGILYFDQAVDMVLNPMCLNYKMIQNSSYMILKTLVNGLYIICAAIILLRSLKRTDIVV